MFNFSFSDPVQIILVVGICLFCLLVGCLLFWIIRRRIMKLTGCCSRNTTYTTGELQMPNLPDDQSYEPMSGLNVSRTSYISKFMTRTLLPNRKQKPESSIGEEYETMHF
ncbi:hypothetical protein HOLleu_22208 [Holothuria leucospilota]|uniref:Uncharacterized protein n=1 Tax=Holothuria leucospilota TaxID=206669 RepID=A0A9Q1BY69_HOLLE|nr:hypothetical protein HOLleu_22208 [Holothuria leucospilota]